MCGRHRKWSLCGLPETVNYHASCETTTSQFLKMYSPLGDLNVVLTLASKTVKGTVVVINSNELNRLLDGADSTTDTSAGATSHHSRSTLPAPETPSYVLLEEPSYGAIRTQFAHLPVIRHGLMGHVPQSNLSPYRRLSKLSVLSQTEMISFCLLVRLQCDNKHRLPADAQERPGAP